MIRLFASDIDGTLNDSTGSMTACTFETIQELTASGVHFVLVTGRDPHSVSQTY